MKETTVTSEIPGKILNEIPARVAIHYTVLPVAIEKGILQLLVPQDLSRELKDELRVALGKRLEFLPTPRREIEEAIARLYGVGAGVIETLTLDQGREEEDPDVAVIDSEGKLDPTITALVNEFFLDAVKYRASDIHVEPFEKSLRIRYRIDGLLQEVRVSEQIRVLAPNLISRIKIMAKLDIGEKRLPQDGRIKIRYSAPATSHQLSFCHSRESGNPKPGFPIKTFGNDNSRMDKSLAPSCSQELDLRVSVLPSSYGEAIVIRILKPLELLSLEELGFDEKAVSEIRTFLKRPHGVVLITGPTGSGKTTTLYSCLKELNQIERKIITIEDPIEYKLPGIIQMQVSPKIKFTFAAALRSILRHDPDVIMIGEIRDSETAEIAIRSALTGHLVFSTLHTNDAPSAVTRLVEMGVEPYLVASALEGVIAQRLVRRCCSHCQGADSRECKDCRGVGFYGRLAIAEIMPMTETISDLVLERRAGSFIRTAAIQNGMKTLYEDGMNKVKRGLTSEEEVQRITCP